MTRTSTIYGTNLKFSNEEKHVEKHRPILLIFEKLIKSSFTYLYISYNIKYVTAIVKTKKL